MQMTISSTGLQMIATFEGFEDHVYMDASDYPTIGYGHRLVPGQTFDTITQDEGLALLRGDVLTATHCINSAVKVVLSQNQFDALCSFVYNCGTSAFRNSTMLKLLNQGDYSGAANEFPRWCHVSNGCIDATLEARRKKEQALFNTPDPDPPAVAA